MGQSILHRQLAERLHADECDCARIVAAVALRVHAATERDHARCGGDVTSLGELTAVIVVPPVDVCGRARDVASWRNGPCP